MVDKHHFNVKFLTKLKKFFKFLFLINLLSYSAVN